MKRMTKSRDGTAASAGSARPVAAPAVVAAGAFQSFLAGLIARGTLPIAKHKQDRSKKRDKEILRAALSVFARDGIARARVGDIAAAAGIPVSTIYEYYASKEELAYSVPHQTMVAFLEEYASAVKAERTAFGRLRLYLWLAADFARRNPEWARVLYLELWPSVLVTQSTLRQAFDDYVRVILYLLRQGEESGEWPAGDHYETAAILNGSVNQVIITALLYRRPRKLSSAAASILDRTMELLQGPGKPARRKTARRTAASQ
jgi:AcrR family transcriptional regulator